MSSLQPTAGKQMAFCWYPIRDVLWMVCMIALLFANINKKNYKTSKNKWQVVACKTLSLIVSFVWNEFTQLFLCNQLAIKYNGFVKRLHIKWHYSVIRFILFFRVEMFRCENCKRIIIYNKEWRNLMALQKISKFFNSRFFCIFFFFHLLWFHFISFLFLNFKNKIHSRNQAEIVLFVDSLKIEHVIKGRLGEFNWL